MRNVESFPPDCRGRKIFSKKVIYQKKLCPLLTCGQDPPFRPYGHSWTRPPRRPLCFFVSLSLCLFGSLSLCLFVSLSLCLIVTLSLCLYVCLSHCLFVSLSLCLFLSLCLCRFVVKIFSKNFQKLRPSWTGGHRGGGLGQVEKVLRPVDIGEGGPEGPRQRDKA